MEKTIKTRRILLKIFFFIFLPSLFIFLVLEKKYLQTNFLEKISVFNYAQKNYFIDFKLNKINLNNLKYIKKSEIYEKLDSYYNTKMFSIELDSIREKIKSNQLVSEVSIERSQIVSLQNGRSIILIFLLESICLFSRRRTT